MKRKKNLAQRIGARPPKAVKEPQDIKNIKVSEQAELIFDLRKEFINISDNAVFDDLSNTFKEYVLEFDLVISQVYFDPNDNLHKILFAPIAPNYLNVLRGIVRRRNVVADIRNRQMVKETCKDWKELKPNYTEDWFETPDVVNPDDRKKFGGESLRATYIASLLRNGAPIESVAALVGHRSLASTARYAPPMTLSQIKKNYNKAHPKA